MIRERQSKRLKFQVIWGDAKFSFAEVTGLVMVREQIEYRHKDASDLDRISTPKAIDRNHITMKHGTFKSDFDLKTWLDDFDNNHIEKRRDMIIRLFDEKHEPVSAWSATRCFPVNVTALDLKSDANETAIESIEISHEGLTVISGDERGSRSSKHPHAHRRDD